MQSTLTYFTDRSGISFEGDVDKTIAADPTPQVRMPSCPLSSQSRFETQVIFLYLCGLMVERASAGVDLHVGDLCELGFNIDDSAFATKSQVQDIPNDCGREAAVTKVK